MYKYYLINLKKFFSPSKITFTAVFVYGVLLKYLLKYWDLKSSCTDSFASVIPWGPFSKKFCVQIQLDAGWPCGALNEYQKKVLFAIREHSNSEEFIDLFLILRDDKTINVQATLEAMAEHGWVFTYHEGEGPRIIFSEEHTSAFISAGEYIHYAVVEGGSYILSWFWGS